MPRPGAGGTARVGLYGAGAIGLSVARALVSRRDVELCAVIDKDPGKVGRELGSLLRMKGRSSVKVGADPAAELERARPQVVIHCTGSRLREVAGQIDQVLAAGIGCVTSCEEMALPELADADLAAALDRRARAAGVALLGAGVNPGFIMDALVVALSGATRDVTHVFVERVLDPLSRRKAFQRKVGIGLTYAQARRRLDAGQFGHIGLKESARLVARGLGLPISSLSEEIRIVCDGERLTRRPRRAPASDAPVSGLQQTITARDGAREVIRMEMVMVAGVEGAHDAVVLTGEPPLSLWMQGGVPGDQATVSCLLTGMKHVLSPPRTGLLTILDLPPGPSGRGDSSQGE